MELVEGLSPRSRGSPETKGCKFRPQRSIPALAGKPIADLLTDLRQRVYPRARGEAQR